MSTYINVSQLSARTGYKPSYIRKLCENKTLPHYKPMNGRILFDEEEIAKFFAQTRMGTIKDNK